MVCAPSFKALVATTMRPDESRPTDFDTSRPSSRTFSFVSLPAFGVAKLTSGRVVATAAFGAGSSFARSTRLAYCVPANADPVASAATPTPATAHALRDIPNVAPNPIRTQ